MGSSAKKISVSIVEDNPVHVEWLKLELGEIPEIEISSINYYGKEGVFSIKLKRPTLAIIDFQLSDITGLEVAHKIKTFSPETKTLILTAHNESFIIDRLIADETIDAIAVKGSHHLQHSLSSILHYVAEGGLYIDPCLLGPLREADGELATLTGREFEVFIQFSLGKMDEQIARDLHVDIAHIRNLRSKIAHKVDKHYQRRLALELIKKNAEVASVNEKITRRDPLNG